MISSDFFYSLTNDAECTDWNHDEPYERHLYATNVNCVSDTLTAIPLGVRHKFSPPVCDPSRLAFYSARWQTNIERLYCENIFKGKSWMTVAGELPFDEYIKEMADHKFVISPEGSGYDCFRTWESLYCGRYPVVKRRYFTEYFSLYLPMVVIDDWDEVTEEFLLSKYDEFKSKEWNLELLSEEYWINKCQRCK